MIRKRELHCYFYSEIMFTNMKKNQDYTNEFEGIMKSLFTHVSH